MDAVFRSAGGEYPGVGIEGQGAAVIMRPIGDRRAGNLGGWCRQPIDARVMTIGKTRKKYDFDCCLIRNVEESVSSIIRHDVGSEPEM